MFGEESAQAVLAKLLTARIAGFEEAVGVAEEHIAGRKDAFVVGVEKILDEAGGGLGIGQGKLIHDTGGSPENKGRWMASVPVGERARRGIDHGVESGGEDGLTRLVYDGHEAPVDLA